jgi:pyruvate,water dikinase
LGALDAVVACLVARGRHCARRLPRLVSHPDDHRFVSEFGLAASDLDVYVMAELPSNIVLADRFAELFDGFSIGSNDLTQLTLGIDRNSEKLAPLFDETDEAVARSVRSLVTTAHEHDCPVGICGDAPSTIPGYTEFLLDAGVDSISVTPDVAVETILTVAEQEE